MEKNLMNPPTQGGDEFLVSLGLDDRYSGGLEEQVRFRLNSELLREIDRTRAFIVSAGYDVSRSDIVRLACSQFVEGFREAVPAVTELVLPEERKASQRRDLAAHSA